MACTLFNSLRESGYSFLWETAKPYEGRPRKSPFFPWMNCEWFLQISYDVEQSQAYTITLVNDTKVSLVPNFDIGVCLIDDTRRVEIDGEIAVKQILSQRRCFSSKRETTIWQATTESILKAIPEFEIHGHFTVSCNFTTDERCDLLPINEKKDRKQFLMLQENAPTNPKASLDNDSSSRSLSLSFQEDLNWHFAPEELSKDFSNLLDIRQLCDVRLRVGERTFPAHKAVLAARSQFFFNKFTIDNLAVNGNATVDGDVIDVDMNCSDLTQLLKFIYSGKLPINLQAITYSNLFIAGDDYKIISLQKACLEVIQNKLNEENFTGFLKKAYKNAAKDIIAAKDMMETVAWFVVKHPTVLTKESWVTFSEDYPKEAMEIFRAYFEK